jgi:peptidoglycan-N-acetylglucosamine deacetylase
MSGTTVESGTTRRGPNAIYLVGAALLAVVCMVLAYQFFLTMTITVDGVEMRVGSSSQVADLISQHKLHGHPGNLVAVKSRAVLKRGQGEGPSAVVNGKPVRPDERLHAGDIVTSLDGKDTVEPLASRVETYAAAPNYEGTGSVETIVADGKPGTRNVSFGSLSKQVVAYRTIVAAKPSVIARNKPRAGEKVVALTFDDGPWPKSTLAVLDILKKNNIKATFFMIGNQARGRKALAKAVADAGMDVGNHSESHPYNAKKMSAAAIKDQIEKAQWDISRASGKTPTFFRPPGGAINPTMYPVLAANKMKLVEWDVDPNDWRKPPAATIVDRVLRHVRPGSVVLMHDGGGDRSHTVQALPEIIKRLRANGYRFVTLDEIANLPDTMG